MKSFTYHLLDQYNHPVDYTTKAKTAKELVEGHEARMLWFEKQGFKIVKADVAKPTQTPLGSTTQSQNTQTCSVCGQPLTFKQGTSKTGKPWKGYFCNNRDHPPVWL